MEPLALVKRKSAEESDFPVMTNSYDDDVTAAKQCKVLESGSLLPPTPIHSLMKVKPIGELEDLKSKLKVEDKKLQNNAIPTKLGILNSFYRFKCPLHLGKENF